MMGPMTSTFTRGQVCEAIWSAMSFVRVGPLPKQFRRRVDKMLEFDVPFATKGLGRGTFAEFSPEDAFQLHVAILLQDSGLPQGHAARVVKHVAARLSEVYRERRREAANPREPLPPGYAPTAPRALFVDGHERLGRGERRDDADLSVFMTLRFKELHETIAGDELRAATFMEPGFHHGVTELAAEMDGLRRRYTQPYRLILELAGPAWALGQALAEAGPAKRGRPGSSEAEQ